VSVLPASAAVQGGRLLLGGVPAVELAAEHGTPLLVYDEDTLRHRARAYLEGLSGYPGAGRAAFACKANSSVEVLRVLFDEGLGADVASEGELACALAAGASGPGIVVHGNNKSDSDVAAAIAARAGLVVIDHAGEPAQVERLAARADRRQQVLVRVTPDIVADTHHKIVTGHAASKFGLAPADALDVLDQVERLPHLEAAGLHVHLGSQIGDLSTYMDAIDWLVEFIEQHGLGQLPVLDLGGGLAIPHTAAEPQLDPQEAVERIVFHLAQRLIAHGLPMPELILEPGRSIVGPAGVTLYTVGSIKPTAAGVTYAAVDGGMSDNPRPALYGAVYDVLVADRAEADPDRTYTIAGKHCESGDLLIEDARLPELRPGDVLAVPATGAYAASMASNYNVLPRPAAVMVHEGTARLIVRRETIDDLLARDLR
jgi:diaminopimelate decarboxylase